ncbi:hypothetical protein [Flavisolibacter nicotianae]|uniref:hypothetical protein n=1 Tax=Flavisolibacter nicotianae TaxID=2364882 RepID=UPI000EB44736|nr:hypothetical protein [Flavisolibacter nicotianae]
MYKYFLLLFVGIVQKTAAQELFVFTDPASGLAARSLNLKLSDHYMPYDRVYSRPAHRLMLDAEVGISRKLTAMAGVSVSNMHTYQVKQEALFVEAKYRCLSLDEVHRHFRMAAFVQASHTKAPFHYDETNLTGDKSGVRLGMIATKLWNRFALSGTLSHTQVLDSSRFNETVYIPRRIYQTLNYSLSGGYLVLPRRYTSYRQVNVNLYGELLAQQALDHKSYYVDAAPALQFIFFSNTKLNVGYRFKLAGNAQRMSNVSWLFSIERSFLNVWK